MILTIKLEREKVLRLPDANHVITEKADRFPSCISHHNPMIIAAASERDGLCLCMISSGGHLPFFLSSPRLPHSRPINFSSKKKNGSALRSSSAFRSDGGQQFFRGENESALSLSL